MMNFAKVSLLLAPAFLSGCAVLRGGPPPYSPLEARYSGTYEGVLRGLTGESAARLVLDVSEKDGSAAGVLTNLRSNKSYTFSGEFIPVGEGGSLSAQLFEKGNRHAANLTANLGLSGGAAQVQGQVRTVLLGQELMDFDLTLRRVQPQRAEQIGLPVTAPSVTAPGAPTLRPVWP
ncbi:hypothetical protein GCM10017783_25680 [Deinococcus piscis]|uniref:DUF306 domain-containing protein n=1 Tax=Deinococcus piscis TaxID=394230 RepID=A0ABQ3KEE2_9DEIO|nr:hypothetical protein [Deinococcus piscis]GHG12467.1 hypothetical protein GCM10017783_25680 [Deinococcus piscis]